MVIEGIRWRNYGTSTRTTFHLLGMQSSFESSRKVFSPIPVHTHRIIVYSYVVTASGVLDRIEPRKLHMTAATYLGKISLIG